MTDYPSLGDWGGRRPAEVEQSAATIAEQLAWSTMLTKAGGRVVLTPITVRPVVAAPVTLMWQDAIAAGSTSAAVVAENGVRLERPVGSITAVTIDGAVLDAASYRVDDGNLLVRTDGQSWPTNQDLNAPVGGPGTFEISYFHGWYPGRKFIAATGLLAAEFYAALAGGKCRLPKGVTSVVRQGVTYEISSAFEGPGTGIREVDVVLALYNANGRRMRTVVASVDTIANAPRRVG